MIKKWPIYFNERLWLVNPEKGFIGVATLWTPKEKIAPEMPSSVAVVGQLYTKAGIEYIVRNLWARPQVSCLVVCGRDDSGSGSALVEFFKKGMLDGQSKPFGSQIPGKDLLFFRRKVKLVNLIGESQPDKIARAVSQLKKQPAFATRAKTFPQSKISGSFPSETTLFRIEAATVGLAWLQVLKTILKFGWEQPRVYVYGGKERTVLNLATVISEEDIKKPKIYPFFLFQKKDLKKYFQDFFKRQRGEQAYTYGERLFDYLGIDQVAIMAKKLKQFPYNKGAIAILWQPTVDNFPKRKPWRTPCLTLIQGICQKEKLHLTAYFRSNDMFGAWPLNAFALRQLQTVLAEKIGKKVGFLTIISHSAFIDKSDFRLAKKIIDENDQLFCRWDPRGNLVIEIARKQIVVKHFSPEGQFLQEFKVDGRESKAALRMAEKLLNDQVISRVDHALDIGEQLGRAEEAIKQGLKFEQDHTLRR